MLALEPSLAASEGARHRAGVELRPVVNGAASDVECNSAAHQIMLLGQKVAALLAREFAAVGSGPRDADAVAAADRSLLAEFALVECSLVLRRALQVVHDAERRGQTIETELDQARRELHELRRRLGDALAERDRTRHQAQHDILTGLPNRLSFRERSSRALTGGAFGGHLTGLLFIDLDGFKAINDRHGHQVGDELLKVVGARLGRAIRAEDIVSRHGGDEFVCLLLDVADEAQVTNVAGKLFDAVSAPCRVGELMLSVTPSIGVALSPRDGTTVEELLESASRAMYAAKWGRAGS